MTKSASSSPAPRTGSQEPSVFLAPSSAGSALEEFAELGASCGLEMFPWQKTVLGSWLGIDAAGLWTASIGALCVARQNGKTLGTTQLRMDGGMLFYGEEVVYTAHLQKTATETFEGMAEFFDSPKLRRHVKDVRTALGREQIILKNGGRVKFLARTRNGGRGQHGDLLVFDEAQELTDEQQGSFLPAISASRNPQTLYVFTPPDENADGSVVRRIRQSVTDGSARRLAYAGWEASEMGDVNDVDRWYRYNPSMGITIQEQTVRGEAEQMAPDSFARERLCWWGDANASAERVIDAAAWDACRTDDPPADGLLCCAVKFAPDGSSVALAVCLRPKGGAPYVECVDSRCMKGGVGWHAAWIEKRRAKMASVAIDGRTGAAALLTRLADDGFPQAALVAPKTADFVAAMAMFVNAVNEGNVAHYGQPGLDAAATLTVRRRIGADGFGFESTDDGDATLVEACALAYWQAMTTKRRPDRKAVVY